MFCRFLYALAISVGLVCCAVTTESGFSQSTVAQTSVVKPSVEDKAFFESPVGVQIAWYASILGVILGLIPLFLYFQERKSSKFLHGLLREYNLAKVVETDVKKATAQRLTANEALNKSKQELEELTKQLEESIPNQARAAFFRAAIPEIERQILYLHEQRKAMEAGLLETGVPLDDSSRLKPILQTEINQTVIARRKLDERQIILSILTGLAASSLAFGPIQYLVRVLLAFFILFAVYGLIQQWAIVYPENRMSKIVRQYGFRLFVYAGTIVLLCTLVFLVLIFLFDF